MSFSSCPGVREADTVRPIQTCQSCAHWHSTSGPVVHPHIVISYRDGKPMLDCTRWVAVQIVGG